MNERIDPTLSACFRLDLRASLFAFAAFAAFAALSACAESPAPSTSGPGHSPASTPAEIAAAAAAAAGTRPPADLAAPRAVLADTDSTPATREARFRARRRTAPPPSLAPTWRRALSVDAGRLTAVAHERHTAWEKTMPFDEVVAELRFFGEDVANDKAMLTVLRELKLPALPDSLPEAEIQAGDVTWKLERHPLIAPAGEIREIRYALRVTRDPVQSPQLPGCRKPRTLDVPPATPAWLRALVSASSTRRLVALRDRRGAEGREDSLRYHLLFHNGEAADEMTGRLVEAATAAGFRRESGAEGNRQVWRGQNAEKLSFKPTTEDLRLGCRVEGPVTVIELVKPLDAAPPLQGLP